MGKKIKESERPAEFSRIRDIVFKGAGVRYASGNIVDNEIYRRALRRFGLVDDSMKFQYPDTIGGYDFKSEEGITSFMGQAAKEYAEIDKGITADPASMKHELWPLFTAEHNPNYPSFVDGELASIKMSYSQLDKILKAGEADIAKARAAAKGTSLEGTVGSPFDLAENLMYTINLRYIQSFGYKLQGFKDKGAANALFDEVQKNLADGAPFKLSKEEQTAKDMEELKSFSESNKSPINSSGPRATPTSEGSATSSINSTEPETKPAQPTPNNTINPATTKSSEPTTITSSEGNVTSKVGEIQTENILDTTPSQAINVNLETKPTTASPSGASTVTSNAVTNTSNSTTVNDVKSTQPTANNTSTSSSNVGVTNDKTIMKVENTNNQSSSNTVNEPPKEKEKSKFLSKVGNFAKKAGAALNLPSVAELGDQTKGLFGATASNISSRVSEVKESFAINSNNRESESSSQTSSSTNSVNSTKTAETNKLKILGESATGSSSNPANVLKTETQNSMTVEQKPPVVAMSSEPATNSTSQQSTTATTAVSNTTNSQTSTQPQTTSNITQTTQPAAQPAATQPGVGVNVDINQLAQSIMRLERILISGIEVTIKDT